MTPRVKSVLHVGKFYPPYPGGIETHLKSLCRGLSPHLQVRVLVSSRGLRREGVVEESFHVTKARNWMSLAGTPLSPGIVSGILRSTEDLVHVHWPNPTAAIAYLAAARHKPLVVSWHSDVVRQRRLSRAFAPILKRFLDRASAIIVTSSNYLATSLDLAEHRTRCRIIPYGIEADAFTRCDRQRVRSIREAYGNRIILAVGRLVYYKGLEHLIRAMRRVPGTLVIIGEGPLLRDLEEEARAAGVGDRVVFAGTVDDVASFYHACDVFALPSVARTESFGIVQLEAMAAGKPVVNTALPSTVPLVSLDGSTGITVPPADASSLAVALNRLLDDKQLREAYGFAAARRVRDRFSIEAMTSRTLDVYREVGELDGHSDNGDEACVRPESVN